MREGDGSEAIRGDMMRREVVDTHALVWQPSPSPSVWRKRLHLVGGRESGQVTSLVRYGAGSQFPAHDHPEGEEILVLEGVFSDHRGDHGAGSYLLDPEGFRHAPASEPGCVIFVKLRQYGGAGRELVELDTRAMDWQPGDLPGVDVKILYRTPRFPDAMQLERWSPGAAPGARRPPGGLELLVLEGSLEDERGCYREGTWLRLPPGAAHVPRSPVGCILYVKTGGVAGLRSEPDRR